MARFARRRLAILSVLGIVALTSCGAEPAAAPAVPETTSTVAATTTTTAAVTTTTEPPRYEWPADSTDSMLFWGPPAGPIFEIPRFGTIEELAESASVVLIGVPVDYGPTLRMGGDPDNNETVSSPSVIVEVVEVVRSRADILGLTNPSPGDRITVIVDHRPDAILPNAPALLFLQMPGDERHHFILSPEDAPEDGREAIIEQFATWEAFRAGKYLFYNTQSILVGDTTSTRLPRRYENEYDPLDDVIDGVPIADIVELIRSMPPPAL
jgi:hypothetical protein